MRKTFLLLPLALFAQLAFAIDANDVEAYKKNYSEQLRPMVMKKLGMDRPDLTASAIKREADAYVAKMAGCQLEGLAIFPEQYREKAILPVAQGGDVAQATQALNEELKKDIDGGKISKDEVMTIIQSAQQAVQICANS